MMNLNSELKDKKAGEGIIFIKTSDDTIMKINFHIGEDGYLYAGSKKIRFDTQKIKKGMN